MLKNLSKIRQVLTCFSFNKASFWIKTEAFRIFPASLRVAAFLVEDTVPFKNSSNCCGSSSTAGGIWSGKTWSLPESELWTSMKMSWLFLPRVEEKEKREKIIFCFWIPQMFLAFLGSQITHSPVKPLTVYFGTCDPWQHLVYLLPGDIFGCGNK